LDDLLPSTAGSGRKVHEDMRHKKVTGRAHWINEWFLEDLC